MSCMYCRKSPHDKRCPLADNLPIFCECDNCGRNIYIGDQYYEIGDKKYCSHCVNEGWNRAEVDDE